MVFFQKTPPFRLGLEISILVHSALFFTLSHAPSGVYDLTAQWARRDPIEIDLTRPHRLTSDPKKSFRSTNPGTGAPRVEKPTPEPFQAGGGVAAKGVDWTLPTPATKIFENLTDIGNPLSKSTAPSTGTGTAEGESKGLGGLGTGGDGEVDWVYLSEIPRLLNRDELVKNVLRLYPKTEREAGREARVVLSVHLNRDGGVSGAEVEESAGPHFDAAAIKVMSTARFSPARAGDRNVAVHMFYPIDFVLTGE